MNKHLSFYWLDVYTIYNSPVVRLLLYLLIKVFILNIGPTVCSWILLLLTCRVIVV